jgi:hypothetical protein
MPAATGTPVRYIRVYVYGQPDAVVAGLFAGGTVARFPLDRRIALDMQGSSLRTNSFVQHSADVVRVTAVPGNVIIGGTLYAVGRVTHCVHRATHSLIVAA